MKKDILKISIWDRDTVSVKFCEDWHEIVWQFPWRIDLYGAFFILSKQMAKNGLASYWEITEGLQRARKSGPLGGSGGTNGEPVRIIRGSPSHITSHWSLRNWIRKRKQMHFGIQRESPSVAVISDPQYEPTNEQMIRYCSEWLHRQTEDQIRTECVFYHLRWAARSFWTLSTQPIYLQILRWQCCLAENPNNPITSLMNEKACVLSHLMDIYKAYLVLGLPPSPPESGNDPNFGHRFFSHLVLHL